MAIDPELLAVLVCPETHQPVKPADSETLGEINSRAKAGTLKNHSGEAVSKEIEAGLLREDGKCLYIIEDDIPNMLIDERIDL